MLGEPQTDFNGYWRQSNTIGQEQSLPSYNTAVLKGAQDRVLPTAFAVEAGSWKPQENLP